jgi:hypothetical protein
MSSGARIQLARQGAVIERDPAAIAEARAEFEATHVLKLPAFVNADLLAEAQQHIAAGIFHSKVHKASGVEMCMEPNAAVWMLRFLMVSADVLRYVGDITGADELTSFFGRVYRLDPETDQRHDWHDDVEDGRQLGFSLNLSTSEFEGGALQLRERDPERITATVYNTTPGDAVIFKLHPNVQHQVHPITGTVPRTVFAGWFRSGDDVPKMPR